MNAIAAIHDVTFGDAAAQPGAETEDHVHSVRLDLHPALAVLGYYDGVYVVISDLPAGTRLSAGRSNTNSTWSLLPDELEDLSIILPPQADATEFLLTVSIATPDPDGYDFASMTAQFHVHVAKGTSTVPFNSMKRTEPQRHPSWPDLVQHASQSKRSRLDTILGQGHGVCNGEKGPLSPHFESTPMDSTVHADLAAWRVRQLAAERAEWQADEEARLMRARAQWEAEAENIWAARVADLAKHHEREMIESDARWHLREQERATVTDALWSARLAASEVCWRSEESERFARAIGHWHARLRSERWRRAASWLVFVVTVGSMLVV
jgi:hypothetical protein